MASQKKVIVRQFAGPLLRGYLPATVLLEQLSIQLLDLSGRVQPVQLSAIKSIAYVNDFNLDDDKEPERLGRRSFSSRPRGEVLLLRLEFKDRDRLEGEAAADLSFFAHLVDEQCISIVPPDQKSNTYRLLIPRSALVAAEIVSFAPATKKRKQDDAKKALQNELFERAPD